MPVYWNCHDLAIRLAYIIIQPSMDVLRILRELTMLLHQAFHKEFNWLLRGGWTPGARGSIASPLATVDLFIVGCSVAVFGGVVALVKENARRQSMVKLEEKFPQLKSFHKEITISWCDIFSHVG